METRLLLPPVYRQKVVGPDDAPLALARRHADDGDAEALFVSARNDARADCAVILVPDRPLAHALKVSYVAMAGIGDALGSLVPPAVEVAFAWPDRIDINGATAGGIRVAVPAGSGPADVPDWMILGLTLRVMPDPAATDPGRTPDRTTLFDEGCGEVTTAGILESFSRHFLYWINRWDEDGFAAVQASWMHRASGRAEPVSFAAGKRRVDGTILSIDDDGGLAVRTETGMAKLALADALAAPTWDALE